MNEKAIRCTPRCDVGESRGSPSWVGNLFRQRRAVAPSLIGVRAMSTKWLQWDDACAPKVPSPVVSPRPIDAIPTIATTPPKRLAYSSTAKTIQQDAFPASHFHFTMAKTGIVFGLVMSGLTVVCLFISMEKSLTQFVPMIFGILLLVLGIVSLNPHWRFRATLASAVLMLVGSILGAVRALVLWSGQNDGDDINELSLRVIVVMTVFCLTYALVATAWLRGRERRRRKAIRQSPPPTSSAPLEKAVLEKAAPGVLVAEPDRSHEPLRLANPPADRSDSPIHSSSPLPETAPKRS